MNLFDNPLTKLKIVSRQSVDCPRTDRAADIGDSLSRTNIAKKEEDNRLSAILTDKLLPGPSDVAYVGAMTWYNMRYVTLSQPFF